MANFKKWLCLALAALMIITSVAIFSSCAKPEDPSKESTPPTVTGDTGIDEDHRFDNVDFKNREFIINTSIHSASTGMGNSNSLIEGTGSSDGSLVNDAVFARNTAVEELLKVKLTYVHMDLNYDTVPAEVRKLVQGNADEFHVFINDLFPFANLSIEGTFLNVTPDDEETAFDFERNYWYSDYMEDLCLMEGYQYLLAGDYFIDIIRSAHLLLLNKDIYKQVYKTDADALYDEVINYEWTFARMNDLITSKWIDKNGSGQKDKGDQFGFVSPEPWGGSIAYTISGNPTFIRRDEDGVPEIVLTEGDRSNQLSTAMTAIFNNESSAVSIIPETELLTSFANGDCLIVDYQRLGSLENAELRQMEGDAAILPYPMLFAADKKYVTSAHDTTEIGAIPTTADGDLEFISTVLEVLNRETANILMPKYYKEGLQVQYVDDSKAASMIDIIHDNFDNSFALAYNEALGGRMLQSFSDAMTQKREFSVVYANSKRSVEKALETKLRDFLKNNVNK